MSAELLSWQQGNVGDRGPLDYIVLGGQFSPGLCEIGDAWADYEYRVKSGKAITGAFIAFMKRKLTEFQVHIRCYTPQDLADFEVFRSAVLGTPDRASVVQAANASEGGKTQVAKALEIKHPILQDIGITAVVVQGVSAFKRIHESGIWQVSIKFLQYVGLPKQTDTKMNGAKAAPQEPENPQDKAISDLTGQVATEGKKLVNRLLGAP